PGISEDVQRAERAERVEPRVEPALEVHAAGLAERAPARLFDPQCGQGTPNRGSGDRVEVDEARFEHRDALFPGRGGEAPHDGPESDERRGSGDGNAPARRNPSDSGSRSERHPGGEARTDADGLAPAE